MKLVEFTCAECGAKYEEYEALEICQLCPPCFDHFQFGESK
jgi:hypothetical protein